MEPASSTSLDSSLFIINIKNPQFLSAVQSPFDNCQSPFSPTTFLEIGICLVNFQEKSGNQSKGSGHFVQGKQLNTGLSTVVQ